MGKTVRETFRVPAEPDLAAIDPRARPLGPRDRSAAAAEIVDLADRLDHLQEALYAEATAGVDVPCCSCCREWTPPARAA
jgi:hypothetical protein